MSRSTRVLLIFLAGWLVTPAASAICWMDQSTPKVYVSAEEDYHIAPWIFLGRIQDVMAQYDPKGYTVTVVGPKGDVVASLSDGLARGACDPDGYLEMDRDVVVGWGSASKVYSTALGLRALERSFYYDVDTPTVDVMPYRWRNGVVHSHFDDQTIGDMMGHTGGFHKSPCTNPDGTKDDVYERYLKGDRAALTCFQTNSEKVGKEVYSNMALIVGEFFGYYAYPWTMYNFELLLPAATSMETYNTVTLEASHNLFIEDMRSLFTERLGTMADMCGTASRFVGTGHRYANVFTGPNDYWGTVMGQDPAVNPLVRCSQGALVASSEDAAKMLWQIRHTDNVISPESYALMENGSDSMGWNKMGRIGFGGYAYGHNGSWSNHLGGGTVKAWVAVFSTGHVVAFSANSNLAGKVEGLSFQAHLKQAFMMAREPVMKARARKSLPSVYLATL